MHQWWKLSLLQVIIDSKPMYCFACSLEILLSTREWNLAHTRIMEMMTLKLKNLYRPVWPKRLSFRLGFEFESQYHHRKNITVKDLYKPEIRKLSGKNKACVVKWAKNDINPQRKRVFRLAGHVYQSSCLGILREDACGNVSVFLKTKATKRIRKVWYGLPYEVVDHSLYWKAIIFVFFFSILKKIRIKKIKIFSCCISSGESLGACTDNLNLKENYS